MKSYMISDIVKVRMLIWRDDGNGNSIGTLPKVTKNGWLEEQNYVVYIGNDGYHAYHTAMDDDEFIVRDAKTIDEAKAACQKDFEHAIMRFLEVR